MVLPAQTVLSPVPFCSLDDLPREGSWAVLTKDLSDGPALIKKTAVMGDRLAVQEVWKSILPDAALLISSAICGGTMADRLKDAAAERRCILLIEPILARFPLPCTDCRGEPVAALPEKGFYSSALCCYYTHSRDEAILWDTEATILEKLRLAKEAGFEGYVYPSP